MAEPRPCYDPTRDLAVLVHAAVRQGFWQPSARGSVVRLQEELGFTDYATPSDVEALLAAQLNLAGRRLAALENVRYLSSLSDDVLREALLVFTHEQPGKAAELLRWLTREEAASA